MAKCDVCGRTVDMPYNCRGCGGTFCSEHRLPENHGCSGLDDWNDPDGVFDSGFDDSVAGSRSSGGLADRLPVDTSPGGALAYVRGNVAYTFLALMLVTFLAEFVVLFTLGVEAFRALFVLTSDNWFYVWTWVTSVFAHSPAGFGHIFGNGIVLFFFGPVLEQRIGSKRFAALFLVAGMVAGLGQIGFGFLLAATGFGTIVSGVLGASGAIMAILAVLTVLNPDLKVYLYFILPLPIWLLTGGYALLSVAGVLTGFSAFGAGGNIAHFAHLGGLVLGLVYGYRIQSEVRSPEELRLGRGAGPGGPGGPGRGPGGRL